MEFKTSPENQAVIDKLADILRETAIGATVNYADLSSVAGEPVQRRRHILLAAVKAAEKATGSRYSAVRCVGIKRLRPDDLPGIGAEYIRKTRRTAQRGIAKLDTRDNLPPETARKVTAQRAQLGAVALFTKPAATERLEGSIPTGAPAPSMADTVRLLAG